MCRWREGVRERAREGVRERESEREIEGVRRERAKERVRRDKQIDTDTAITLTYVVTDTEQEWVSRSDTDRLTGLFNRNNQEYRFRDEVKFECHDKREQAKDRKNKREKKRYTEGVQFNES